ncbi:MAG: hypothetical protein WBC97_11655 [Gemmatimonadales bacterium]
MLLASALIVVGCNDPDSTGPSPILVSDFVMSPTVQWSGGVVQVRSSAFSHLTTAQFTLLAGTESLVVTRLDDSTVSVTPSDAGTRTVSFRAVAGTDTVSIGSVQFFGFTGMSTLPTPIYSEYSPWPVLDPTGVLGSTPAGNVAVADLPSGTVTSYGLRYSGFDAVGPSYRAGVVTVPGATITDSSGLWQLGPNSTRLGALPFNSQRYQWEIGPHTWLEGFSESIKPLITLDSGATWQLGVPTQSTYGVTNITRVAYSPRADRVAITGIFPDDSGAVVIDPATGAWAYHVSGIYEVYDAVFSADGSVLYLAAALTGHIGWSRLFSVDAITGAVLHVAPMPDSATALAVAVDPGTGQVAALFGDSYIGSTTLGIAVFDPTSLAQTATLRVPAGPAQTCPANCYPTALIISNRDRAAFALLAQDKVVRFDLLPRSGTPALRHR